MPRIARVLLLCFLFVGLASVSGASSFFGAPEEPPTAATDPARALDCAPDESVSIVSASRPSSAEVEGSAEAELDQLLVILGSDARADEFEKMDAGDSSTVDGDDTSAFVYRDSAGDQAIGFASKDGAPPTLIACNSFNLSGSKGQR